MSVGVNKGQGVISTIAVPVERLRVAGGLHDCIRGDKPCKQGVIVPCPVVVERCFGVVFLAGEFVMEVDCARVYPGFAVWIVKSGLNEFSGIVRGDVQAAQVVYVVVIVVVPQSHIRVGHLNFPEKQVVNDGCLIAVSIGHLKEVAQGVELIIGVEAGRRVNSVTLVILP